MAFIGEVNCDWIWDSDLYFFLYCFHGDTSLSSSSRDTIRMLQTASLYMGSHFGYMNFFSSLPFVPLLQCFCVSPQFTFSEKLMLMACEALHTSSMKNLLVDSLCLWECVSFSTHSCPPWCQAVALTPSSILPVWLYVCCIRLSGSPACFVGYGVHQNGLV